MYHKCPNEIVYCEDCPRYMDDCNGAECRICHNDRYDSERDYLIDKTIMEERNDDRAPNMEKEQDCL